MVMSFEFLQGLFGAHYTSHAVYVIECFILGPVYITTFL